MIYQPGQRAAVYADIYPATITPLPAGVPANSSIKLRAIITERALTIGWSVGTKVERVDIEMDTEEIAPYVSYHGGVVGGYNVQRRGGCPSCGARVIKSWNPFPGVFLVSTPIAPEQQQQAAAAKPAPFTGRYSRD